MEPSITADVIYSLFLKLKGDGLNNAEIKKALVDGVMGKSELLKSLNKEIIFIQKRNKTRIKRRSIAYSVVGFMSIYLALVPFMNEKALHFSFLIAALCITTFLIIKLRGYFPN